MERTHQILKDKNQYFCFRGIKIPFSEKDRVMINEGEIVGQILQLHKSMQKNEIFPELVLVRCVLREPLIL